ncbi:basic blue protein-like protein [Carex littledalei]|uniref:Plantacyanin n=1 Tax=Carex littledalei TaxID=544730 RepID=A0A833R2U3_9POAL|nr:basic blue protein-like protein [Carex littledalei]
MAKGSGSAIQASILVLALLCLVIHIEIADAAPYNVGWTPYTARGWPNRKFKAGDVLVFKYYRSAHNVIRVNAINYNRCQTPKGARVLRSGNDRVTLTKGMNYFICNFPGHCESGMKIAINAA